MHCKSYSHFFSKKFQHICLSLDVNFNESLTNDIVSFEQLGPEFLSENFVFGGEIFNIFVFACFRNGKNPFYIFLTCLNIAGWMANSEDSDQMSHVAASDLGLHCLHRPDLGLLW